MSFSGVDELPGRTRERLWAILDPVEHIITVDHRAIWRRHLAWAKKDGGELRNHLTQRYAANMVFMSLMLSVNLMILFNSSRVTTDMRAAMSEVRYHDVKFWIGLVIFVAAFLTVFTLVSTFTAWGIVSSISDSNAHCFLRSSIGQYAAQLPSRLLASSIYSFLLWLSLWAIELLPLFFSIGLLLVMTILFHHIVTVYSAFGRLIILTGGMGSKHVLEESLEKALLPSGLTSSLLHSATGCTDKQRLSATVQYRGGSQYVDGTQPAKKVFRPKEGDNKRTKVSFMHGRDGLRGNDSILTVESEIIRQNAHAMSGAPPVPALGPAGHVSTPVRHPMKESLIPLSPVSNPSEDGVDPDASPGGADRSASCNSEGSSQPEKEARIDIQSRGNVRANRGRIAMSNTTEWTHESMARMMYDAPPAAGVDYAEEDNPNKEGERRLSNFQRASLYNRSVLMSPKRHVFWGKTSDETDDEGRNPSGFFRGPTLPLTKMLSKVLEVNFDEDSVDSTSSSGSEGKVSNREESTNSAFLSPENIRLLERTGDHHNYDLVVQDEEVESLEIRGEDASREKETVSGADAC